ncbi:MAG: pantoate--beta-alanine ligase [Lentisphaerae bacterium]|nr:MAG: pantoate--beta-alanine ligase [Lentisphaerota bacterium]
MQVIESIRQMQQTACQWHSQNLKIAAVPTMGCLHDGHLALVRKASQLADRVVVSIFVNPTQFAPGEDFDRYPRTWEQDKELCERHGVDVIFYPSNEEMYPADYSTYVEETKLSRPLCGERRPGHFRGVTTVVAKLFNAILPDIAVFGEKDAQQACVIKRMVRDLNFPVEIVTHPTVREADGLAMSSRNRYLSPEQRQQALAIFHALSEAKNKYRHGERNPANLEQFVRNEIEKNSGKVDYVEIRRADDLSRPGEAIDGPAILFVAAWFGEARLIDNIKLDHEP